MEQTPKQKAEELITKMYHEISCGLPHDRKSAIDCAVVAIEEMLKVIEDSMLFKQSKRDWYREVKNELVNMK